MLEDLFSGVSIHLPLTYKPNPSFEPDRFTYRRQALYVPDFKLVCIEDTDKI
jgi:hypothetical protein